MKNTAVSSGITPATRNCPITCDSGCAWCSGCDCDGCDGCEQGSLFEEE